MGTITLLRRTELDTDMEVTFTFCIAYLTYYTGEVFLHVSGVLSVVVLGVCISSYKSSINYEQEETSTVHQCKADATTYGESLTISIRGSREKQQVDPTLKGKDGQAGIPKA
ncbi:hypothetical protein TNCV_3077151 [Trichonephila clavipes]|nr:hypothetical protein TNCV_3077151 [Trichonephila clavipes]